MQSSVVIDITSLNALESVLRGRGEPDPWWEYSVGQIGDAVTYASRVVVPAPDEDEAFFPGRTYEVLNDALGSSIRVRQVREHRLRRDARARVRPYWGRFRGHLHRNIDRVRTWLHVHERLQGRRRLRRELPSLEQGSLGALLGQAVVDRALHGLRLTEFELAYVLDVGLRFPVYADLADAGGHYFSHPVRTMTFTEGITASPARVRPLGPISFQPALADAARRGRASFNRMIRRLAKNRERVAAWQQFHAHNVPKNELDEVAHAIGVKRKGVFRFPGAKETIAALAGLLGVIGARPLGIATTCTSALLTYGALAFHIDRRNGTKTFASYRPRRERTG